MTLSSFLGQPPYCIVALLFNSYFLMYNFVLVIGNSLSIWPPPSPSTYNFWLHISWHSSWNSCILITTLLVIAITFYHFSIFSTTILSLPFPSPFHLFIIITSYLLPSPISSTTPIGQLVPQGSIVGVSIYFTRWISETWTKTSLVVTSPISRTRTARPTPFS